MCGLQYAGYQGQLCTHHSGAEPARRHDSCNSVPMLKGLLMYLEREANHEMLREIAGGDMLL